MGHRPAVPRPPKSTAQELAQLDTTLGSSQPSQSSRPTITTTPGLHFKALAIPTATRLSALIHSFDVWDAQTMATLRERFGYLSDEMQQVLIDVRRRDDRRHPFYHAACFQVTARWDLDRYTNILPFDYNRVRLVRPRVPVHRLHLPLSGQPLSSPALSSTASADHRGEVDTEGPDLDDDDESDYINASWVVPPWQGGQVYIATQGPISSTIADFWWMVWQQQVAVIVMLTKAVEKGALKCDVYWPSVGSSPEALPVGSAPAAHPPRLQFAELGLQVSLVGETYDESLGAIVRQLQLCRRASTTAAAAGADRAQTLQITQLHYQSWPDHDVPKDPAQFQRLRSAVHRYQQHHNAQQSPVVVHCSAGCGRTGTLIALDYVQTILESSPQQDPAAHFALLTSDTPPSSQSFYTGPRGMAHRLTIRAMRQSHPILAPVAAELFAPYRGLSPQAVLAAGDIFFDMVRFLRCQRIYMVQSLAQYCFGYAILATAATRLPRAPGNR
ncbi:tyrosine protein phosphatase 1 [Dimargaris verticillata]|uniref:protein-tyrosine-phosphatase n=1 Tax=Dimargaris verticillata TaxID=2761393 RepID=A0A9W8EG25_9FUNG|nr:tyrosine protein phosphatase 1 [Dimargaris verticillata]